MQESVEIYEQIQFQAANKSPLTMKITSLSISLIVMLSIQFGLVHHVAAQETKRSDATVENRQSLFTSGNSGYKTYRIPAIVKSKEDTLLAFAEGRVNGQSDHGDVDLVLRRSVDNGKTWGEMQIIRDDGKHQAGNPCPLVDQKSGKIFLFYCGSRHSEGQVLGGVGSREVYVMTSTDDGQSWSEPRNLSASAKKPSWRWYATGPCSAIQIQSGKHAGRLIVPANHSIHFDDGRKWEYRCHSLYSDDQGETWQVGTSSAVGGSETQIAEVGPDLLIQDVRMQTHRKGVRAVRFSRDGGATWDAIEHDTQRPCPKCQGSIIAIPSEKGGNQRLVSSNPAGKGRTHMTVYQSLDAGKNWEKISLLEAGPTAYSDLVVTADNRVVCFFETGSKSPYESLVIQFIDGVGALEDQ